MASVCDSFHANIWRPSICVNCYKPKTQHHNGTVRSRAASTIVRTESTQLSRKNSYQRNRRSKTVSPSPEESKLRQLIANRKMAVVQVGQMGPALAGRLPTTLNMPVVGVVKPYAVVSIDAENPEEQDDHSEESDTNKSRRHSVPNVKVHSINATPNPRESTSTAVHKTSAPTLSNDYFRRSSTPENRLNQSEDSSNSQTSTGSSDKIKISDQDWKRRIRHGSVEPLEVRNVHDQAVSLTRSHSFRRNRFEASQGMLGGMIPKRKAPPPPPRLSSITNRSSPSRYSVTSVSKNMPPSSPHPIRKNSAALHQILQYSPVTAKQKEELQQVRTTQTMKVLARPRAMTVSNGDSDKCYRPESVKLRKDSSQIRQRRSPPEKPPRTLSTFISSEEQSELVCDLQVDVMDDNAIAGAESHQQDASFQCTILDSTVNGHTTDEFQTLPGQNQVSSKSRTLNLTLPAGCTGSLRAARVRGDPTLASPGSSLATPSPMDGPHDQTYYMDVYSQISEILSDTLTEVYDREMGRLFCRENLWQVEKKEIKIIHSEKTANWRGMLFSTQDIEIDDGVKRLLKISQLLNPHPNLCLIRALIPSPLRDTGHAPAPPTLLLDHTTGDVSSLILPQRETLNPQDYLELVLLCLVQLFSALTHLYNNGVCHRDVGLENLLVTQVGQHWLLRLGNFNFALHRSGPVTATTFIYGYHELQWLGGAGSRLPPEVTNTPENAQTVDYSHTDCFAAGCLIYELMGGANPFERDPELIYYQYSDIDLPPFEGSSVRGRHLQRLALLLLKREQKKRVSASTGLLICEALLWLPLEWLQEPVSEVDLRRHLAMERSRLVGELAKREDSSVSLPSLLKAHFLLNCVPSELIRAYSAFSKHHT